MRRTSPTTAMDARFGLGTTAFDRPQYDPNIDVMWDALVAIAALWRAGTGPGDRAKGRY